MGLLIGIDGGGTKTRVLVTDAAGAPLGYAMAGPSNPKAVGLESCTESIGEALTRALRGTTSEQRRGAVMFAGLAGVRTEHDRAAVGAVLTAQLPKAGLVDPMLELGRDLDVALAGSLQGAPGVVLVVGTGSAAYGRNAVGDTAQAGGWGWYIDDPGSGFWMGYRAMRAAARAHDGRSGPTQLQELVRNFLRLRALDEMPNVIYNPHFSRERVAELCPLIFEAAANGDVDSTNIIEEGARELALMVNAVTQRLQLSGQIQIALNGGVARSGELFTGVLKKAISAWLRDFTLQEPQHPPVVGGVVLAARKSGREFAPHIVNSLSSYCRAQAGPAPASCA